MVRRFPWFVLDSDQHRQRKRFSATQAMQNPRNAIHRRTRVLYRLALKIGRTGNKVYHDAGEQEIPFPAIAGRHWPPVTSGEIHLQEEAANISVGLFVLGIDAGLKQNHPRKRLGLAPIAEHLAGRLENEVYTQRLNLQKTIENHSLPVP